MTVLIAVTLINGATTVGAAAVGGYSWGPAASSYAVQAQPCADLLFVGVRGSGERVGLGDKVDFVRDALQDGMRAAGSPIMVRQTYVDYTAANVNEILPDLPRVADGLLTGEGDLALLRSNYLNSINDGVARLQVVLADSRRRCPDERWVLAGYSQGALVVSTVLATMGNSAPVAGAFLLADPANYPNRGDIKMGSASATLARGISALGPQRLSLPQNLQNRGTVFTYCDDLDVVCDTRSALGPIALSLAAQKLSDLHVPGFASLSTDDREALKRAAEVHSNYTEDELWRAAQPLMRLLLRLPYRKPDPAPSSPPSPTSQASPDSPDSPASSTPPDMSAPARLAPAILTCLQNQWQATHPAAAAPDSFSYQDLAAIDNFTCWQPNDLQGLQYFTGLRTIALPGYNGSLQLVASLQSLTTVKLSSISLAEVASLATAPQLTSLSIEFPIGTDLSPIALLTNLRELTLTGTGGTSDFSALERLTNLRTFTLNATALTDFRPMTALHDADPSLTMAITDYGQIFSTATAGTPETIPTVFLPDGSRTAQIWISTDSISGDLQDNVVTWQQTGTGKVAWSGVWSWGTLSGDATWFVQ